ncbi:MAG: histidine kinase, partial [Saprospiraceae bacterium]|nr:histidine kinase [Saprospiraceae bacterium]
MERVNWIRILYHICFWLVYLLLNSWLGSIFNRVELFKAFLGEAVVLPVKILLTYFVFYFIIPLYLDRDKVWKLVGLSLLAFAVATLLYRMVTAWIFFPIFEPGRTIPFFYLPGLYLTSFDLFITVAAATTIKMIRVHYKSLEFEQELLREKLQSELKFLRAQTNPHFLFNTLNNLYVLARKKSDHTADAIMMLSKIMRFVLYDCRSPFIPVEEETKVIQDYIELEKLRYNKRLQVEYREAITPPGGSIAPLLLLPFVENCFKHGAGGTTGDVKIWIDLRLNQNLLEFEVRNTVEDVEPAPNPEGIGLKNVRRQLDLLYP